MKHLKNYLYFYLGCDIVTSDGRMKLSSVNIIDGYCIGTIGANGPDIDKVYPVEDVKLVLRTVFDMSHEEKEMLDKEFPNDEGIEDIFEAAELTQWYCERGLDVFDLILDGLAVDAKTLVP